VPENPALTSSELGILWITYQQKTMIFQMLDHFIETADDPDAKEIMSSLQEEVSGYLEQITAIFKTEGAVIPVGFTKEDVNKTVPRLYENGFDIMLIRMIKEISMAMHTLNLTMSYRQDIMILFRDLTSMTQKYYDLCTTYLLSKGLLVRPPYIPMPKEVEFVKDHTYLSGMNLFSKKRTLNTVEIAHIFHAIESNYVGMQMIFGFAQCANDQEVSKYFSKGGELAKNIIKEMSEVLLQTDLPVPATSGGNISASTVAPFSDKLMMYLVSLFCSFSQGGNSVGTAFSLRNDLPAKMARFMKDIFEYAHQGAKIMINNGWMEEPPQFEKPQKG
jgi:hypothetical protein